MLLLRPAALFFCSKDDISDCHADRHADEASDAARYLEAMVEHKPSYSRRSRSVKGDASQDRCIDRHKEVAIPPTLLFTTLLTNPHNSRRVA